MYNLKNIVKKKEIRIAPHNSMNLYTQEGKKYFFNINYCGKAISASGLFSEKCVLRR
jgi:hypothetical protein